MNISQYQKQQHTTTNCPQRSMAWITINKSSEQQEKEQMVISATKEMIQLLNQDPTNQPIHTIWTQIESDQSYQIVSTLKTCRILCICSHSGEQEGQEILICTDITDLNHMYTKRQQNISIIRLSMYGTIEAAFQSQDMMSLSSSTRLSVGQPMMRYIHDQDVQEFCAGLNEASKFATMTNFSVRLEHHHQQQYDFSVMMIDDGKILCLIKPSNNIQQEQHKQKQQLYFNNKMIQETVTQMQSKFWYAIENGMAFVARGIAMSLFMIFSTVWQLCSSSQEDKLTTTWSGLFATSSEYMLRKIVKCTKERPEIDKLTLMMSWIGVSRSSSRWFIDHTLDQTTDWLISHYIGDCCTIHEYDVVV